MKSIPLSCLFFLLIQPLFAQLNTKGIAVFKDGNSFIYKQGTVETTNNQFRIKGDTIPNGLFGTFWVASPFLAKVTSIMDSVEVKNQRAATTFEQYLALNKGKSVLITMDDQTVVKGIIESIKFGNLSENSKGGSDDG